MNYYKLVNMEGATFAVATSLNLRRVEEDKLICTDEKDYQYLMIDKKLYRPRICIQPESEKFKNKCEIVRLYKIDEEEYRKFLYS